VGVEPRELSEEPGIMAEQIVLEISEDIIAPDAIAKERVTLKSQE
jgi:hypothetical protein